MGGLDQPVVENTQRIVDSLQSGRIKPPTPAPVRSAVDAVEARDRAILAFLKEGAASYPAVLAAIPEEPDWTDRQRAEACTLALRRLCLKNLVVHAGDTYMLPMR